MRLKVVLAVASAAVCAAVLAGGASAYYYPNSVVPLFCPGGSAQIPAGSELKLRVRWVARNSGQIDKFLSSQKLTWTVTKGSTTVSRTPNPEFGDRTDWSAPVHSTTVDFNGDGQPDDVWYTDYFHATGITFASGDTGTLTANMTVNAKVDDGFYPIYPKGSTLLSANCPISA